MRTEQDGRAMPSHRAGIAVECRSDIAYSIAREPAVESPARGQSAGDPITILTISY
jgi:hypothetical protein